MLNRAKSLLSLCRTKRSNRVRHRFGFEDPNVMGLRRGSCGESESGDTDRYIIICAIYNNIMCSAFLNIYSFAGPQPA